MLLILGDPQRPDAIVGIEAKACEDYDGTVASKVATPEPSRLPERCNLMAVALFGRPVCDRERRAVLDQRLGSHGYQLWTGAVGTLREAQRLGANTAVFLVHQFGPGPAGPLPDDARHWPGKLAENAGMLHRFCSDLGPTPILSRQTEFIEAGTELRVAGVCSLLDADAP